MIAGHYLEDALVEMLMTAEIGVAIVAGRSKVKRPASYVAVKADDEEARTQNGLWMVETSIWCVTQSDEFSSTERSKELLRQVTRWFGPKCPARRSARGKIVIHGINIVGKREEQQGYVFADILDLRCGVQVES